jgi:hypothetical protein
MFEGVITEPKLDEAIWFAVGISTYGRGHMDDSFYQLRLFQIRSGFIAAKEIRRGQPVPILQ